MIKLLLFNINSIKVFTNIFHPVGNLRIEANKTDFQKIHLQISFQIDYLFPRLFRLITATKYELHLLNYLF